MEKTLKNQHADFIALTLVKSLKIKMNLMCEKESKKSDPFNKIHTVLMCREKKMMKMFFTTHLNSSWLDVMAALAFFLSNPNFLLRPCDAMPDAADDDGCF